MPKFYLANNVSMVGESLLWEIEVAGEDLSQHEVNEETMSTAMYTCVAISAVLILSVNITIINSIMEYTFINILVILDCLDSIAHIPILAQFFL